MESLDGEDRKTLRSFYSISDPLEAQFEDLDPLVRLDVYRKVLYVYDSSWFVPPEEPCAGPVWKQIHKWINLMGVGHLAPKREHLQGKRAPRLLSEMLKVIDRKLKPNQICSKIRVLEKKLGKQQAGRTESHESKEVEVDKENDPPEAKGSGAEEEDTGGGRQYRRVSLNKTFIVDPKTSYLVLKKQEQKIRRETRSEDAASPNLIPTGRQLPRTPPRKGDGSSSERTSPEGASPELSHNESCDPTEQKCSTPVSNQPEEDADREVDDNAEVQSSQEEEDTFSYSARSFDTHPAPVQSSPPLAWPRGRSSNFPANLTSFELLPAIEPSVTALQNLIPKGKEIPRTPAPGMHPRFSIESDESVSPISEEIEGGISEASSSLPSAFSVTETCMTVDSQTTATDTESEIPEESLLERLKADPKPEPKEEPAESIDRKPEPKLKPLKLKMEEGLGDTQTRRKRNNAAQRNNVAKRGKGRCKKEESSDEVKEVAAPPVGKEVAASPEVKEVPAPPEVKHAAAPPELKIAAAPKVRTRRKKPAKVEADLSETLPEPEVASSTKRRTRRRKDAAEEVPEAESPAATLDEPKAEPEQPLVVEARSYRFRSRKKVDYAEESPEQNRRATKNKGRKAKHKPNTDSN